MPFRLCHTANFVTRNIAQDQGSTQHYLQQHLPTTHLSFLIIYYNTKTSTWSCNRSAVHVLSKVSPATPAGRFTPGPQSRRLRSFNLLVIPPNVKASFINRELIYRSFILSLYFTKITFFSKRYTSTRTSQEGAVRQSITESEPADIQETPWRKSQRRRNVIHLSH